LPAGPAGELKRSPDPLAAIRGPTSKGRGREGRGKGGTEKGIGRGRGGGTCSKVLGGMDAPVKNCQKFDPLIPYLSRSLEVTGTDTDGLASYDFQLVFHSNGPSCTVFEIKGNICKKKSTPSI